MVSRAGRAHSAQPQGQPQDRDHTSPARSSIQTSGAQICLWVYAEFVCAGVFQKTIFIVIASTFKMEILCKVWILLHKSDHQAKEAHSPPNNQS